MGATGVPNLLRSCQRRRPNLSVYGPFTPTTARHGAKSACTIGPIASISWQLASFRSRFQMAGPVAAVGTARVTSELADLRLQLSVYRPHQRGASLPRHRFLAGWLSAPPYRHEPLHHPPRTLSMVGQAIPRLRTGGAESQIESLGRQWFSDRGYCLYPEARNGTHVAAANRVPCFFIPPGLKLGSRPAWGICEQDRAQS